MKREIKFRGLRIDGKGWAYGDLLQFHYENKFYILQFYGIESGDSLFNEVSVIPESVGQFTGLQDKNGFDIYEGDLVNVPYNYIGIKEVKYIDEEGMFSISKYKISVLEKIGNIHEDK